MTLNRLKTWLIFGTVCLLIYPFWRCIFTPAERFRFSQQKPQIRTKKFFQPGLKCQQNKAAANTSNFRDFPQHIQNFLYYRHCRHFPMLLDVPDKCGGAGKSADVFLLLVVKSSPLNYDRREVLRKTWAMERQHNGLWIRRIFISGTTGEGHEKSRMNNLLELEQREYSDILQWDFTDSFYNLTLKQILFLEWMERSCPHVRFLLNGDDDVFAHTDNMVEYLQNLKGNDGSKHLFAGYLIQGHGPVRWKPSKYYIPVEIYKEDSYFPYCGGGGFLLSSYTASVIYNMSRSITFHPIDDAYIGMCLAKAGLSPISHIGFRTLGLKIPSNKVNTYDPCYYKDLLVVHRFLPAEMYFMWNKISDPTLKCGRPLKCGAR
ncbi:N-acetyllactosaminide beta-1,3-N-acetylglucosaminyltransferase 3-like [Takifugu flavidus]|nr:N-acetyllactosaminide beta-1,3-N-acetylglucosaminyltransferase 3-like [Takifugu flavidus]XP_056894849.1 N-acetyllactosaminide beta-1,3-N-acetylglucosaminyltransferase 3-like [Takifugu flavidus]